MIDKVISRVLKLSLIVLVLCTSAAAVKLFLVEDQIQKASLATTITIQSLSDKHTGLLPRLAGTLQVLNANFLHADIVLGRVEEMSRSQKEATTKYMAVLQHTDELVVAAKEVPESAKRALDQVAGVPYHANQAIDASTGLITQANGIVVAASTALSSVNKATQDLDALLQADSIPATLQNIQDATKQVVSVLGNVNSTSADIAKVSHTLEQKIDSTHGRAKGYFSALLYLIRVASAAKLLVF